jgi:hypothetical protein
MMLAETSQSVTVQMSDKAFTKVSPERHGPQELQEFVVSTAHDLMSAVMVGTACSSTLL